MSPKASQTTQRLVTRSHRGKPCIDRLRLPHGIGDTVNVEVIVEAGPRDLAVGDVVISPVTPATVALTGFYVDTEEITTSRKKENQRKERVKNAFLRSLTQKSKAPK